MINKIMYQGRLTKDVELKKSASGIDYAEFTIAWSEKYKEAERKCFLRCKAWRQTAKFISEYFHKGQEIVIEGSMETSEWTDKDGNNQSRTTCLIDKAHFCGPKTYAGDNTPAVSMTEEFMQIPDNIADEVPFN